MTAQNPLRLCFWSGPRNVSTALMYSFAQRSDTRAIDEPLYAHYLRVSGAEHPGREVVLASMENDGERVVREVMLGPCDRPVLFMKQMAHHLIGLDWSFLGQTKNVLLLRDPQQVLKSLVKQLPHPQLRDTGLAQQVALLERFGESGIPVIDSREILLNPRDILTQLCAELGLNFEAAMLHWNAGPKPEDGVWADIWYANVHRSTGFEPYSETDEPFPDHLRPLLDECQPLYEKLKSRALRTTAALEAHVAANRVTGEPA